MTDMELALWTVIGFSALGNMIFMYYTMKREEQIEWQLQEGRRAHNSLNNGFHERVQDGIATRKWGDMLKEGLKDHHDN